MKKKLKSNLLMKRKKINKYFFHEPFFNGNALSKSLQNEIKMFKLYSFHNALCFGTTPYHKIGTSNFKVNYSVQLPYRSELLKALNQKPSTLNPKKVVSNHVLTKKQPHVSGMSTH